MGKVYCNKCKYFLYYGSFYCTHPNNKVIKDTAIQRTIEFGYCDTINCDNNCKLSESKPKTFLEKLFKL